MQKLTKGGYLHAGLKAMKERAEQKHPDLTTIARGAKSGYALGPQFTVILIDRFEKVTTGKSGASVDNAAAGDTPQESPP